MTRNRIKAHVMYGLFDIRWLVYDFRCFLVEFVKFYFLKVIKLKRFDQLFLELETFLDKL
jgi:hypothetical protein